MVKYEYKNYRISSLPLVHTDILLGRKEAYDVVMTANNRESETVWLNFCTGDQGELVQEWRAMSQIGADNIC